MILQELQRAKLETGRGGQGGVKKAGGMSSYGGQVSRERWKRFSTLSSPHQGGFSSGPSSEPTPAEPPRPAYSAPARKTTSKVGLFQQALLTRPNGFCEILPKRLWRRVSVRE